MAGSSPLKEKVVVYYEGLFQKDSKDPPWPEFWMLEPNAIWLERTIGTATTEELLKRRNVIAKLVSQAVATLAGKNGHFRRLNAAWTLSIVFANVFSKSWSNFAFDILQLLTASLGDADVLFPALAKELDAMLSGTDRSLKLAAVNLLLVTIAGNTTLNQQPLTEYFFAKTNLLGGLLGVIGDPETDFALSVRSTVALGLLANFRKGEINNLYSNGLTTLVGGPVFERIFETSRTIFRQTSQELSGAAHGTSKASYSANTIVRTFSTMLTDLLWRPASNGTTAGEDEDSLPLQAALLTFYELISSNARFLSAMLQEAEKVARGLTPTTSSADVPSPTSPHGPTPSKPAASTLIEFLSYASYVFQFSGTKREMAFARLALIIVSLLLENTDSIALLYDANARFTVDICRSKPPTVPKVRGPMPLANSLLDILAIAINHNLRIRGFPADFYVHALECIHRCFAHQKRYRIRLPYAFNTVWLALSRLVTFLGAHAADLKDKPKTATLVEQIVALINFALQFGELFLPDTLSTEQLLYEIVRQRNSLTTCKTLVNQEVVDFRNIEKALLCFLPILPTATNTPTTTEEILGLIRKQYDSGALVLVHVPNLDSVPRYTEAGETSYFRSLIRLICADVRTMARTPAK